MEFILPLLEIDRAGIIRDGGNQDARIEINGASVLDRRTALEFIRPQELVLLEDDRQTVGRNVALEVYRDVARVPTATALLDPHGGDPDGTSHRQPGYKRQNSPHPNYSSLISEPRIG